MAYLLTVLQFTGINSTLVLRLRMNSEFERFLTNKSGGLIPFQQTMKYQCKYFHGIRNSGRSPTMDSIFSQNRGIPGIMIGVLIASRKLKLFSGKIYRIESDQLSYR